MGRSAGARAAHAWRYACGGDEAFLEWTESVRIHLGARAGAHEHAVGAVSRLRQNGRPCKAKRELRMRLTAHGSDSLLVVETGATLIQAAGLKFMAFLPSR